MFFVVISIWLYLNRLSGINLYLAHHELNYIGNMFWWPWSPVYCGNSWYQHQHSYGNIYVISLTGLVIILSKTIVGVISLLFLSLVLLLLSSCLWLNQHYHHYQYRYIYHGHYHFQIYVLYDALYARLISTTDRQAQMKISEMAPPTALRVCLQWGSWQQKNHT